MKVLRPFATQQKTMKIRTKLELEIAKAFRKKNIDSLKELLSPHGLYLGVNKPILLQKWSLYLISLKIILVSTPLELQIKQVRAIRSMNLFTQMIDVS